MDEKAYIEFQRLWKQEKGECISIEQAKEYGDNVMGLVKLVVEHRRDDL